MMSDTESPGMTSPFRTRRRQQGVHNGEATASLELSALPMDRLVQVVRGLTLCAVACIGDNARGEALESLDKQGRMLDELLRRFRDIPPGAMHPEVCAVPGCGNVVEADTLCVHHRKMRGWQGIVGGLVRALIAYRNSPNRRQQLSENGLTGRPYERRSIDYRHRARPGRHRKSTTAGQNTALGAPLSGYIGSDVTEAIAVMAEAGKR